MKEISFFKLRVFLNQFKIELQHERCAGVFKRSAGFHLNRKIRAELPLSYICKDIYSHIFEREWYAALGSADRQTHGNDDG